MKKNLLIAIALFLSIIAASFLFKQPKDDRTVIKFASWGSQSEISILAPILEEFEKQNPDIKVDFVHIPQNYFQKVHLLFASNLAPDVVFLNNYYAPKYIKAGLLEDLSPYMKKDDYFEKSYKGFSAGEKIYAFPRDVSSLVIFYNKDLFKKNGVPLPSQNWTMAEFLAAAKKLTKEDFGVKTFGCGFETEMIYLLPYLFSNDGAVLNDDGKKLLIGDSAALDAIDFYADFVNKYKIAPSKAESASLTMAQLFLQGRIAMQLSGRWLVPKYREEAKFDWDIAPFPAMRAGSVVSVDASGYAISKSSMHKKEALRFIEFINSEKSMEKITKSGLIVPARKDAAFSAAFLDKSKKPGQAKTFLDVIETGKPTPVNVNYQKLSDRLKTALEPVFLGKRKARNVFTPELLIDLDRYAY